MRKIIALLLLVCVGIVDVSAQICGCTDPLAANFDQNATINDGSCVYASTTISPIEIGELDSVLSGTSGLIFWNGGYWTYNDHDDVCLHQLDTVNALTLSNLCINGIGNYDTEDISQDSLYLYLGDFGNNAGTRQNLHILRIEKASLETDCHVVDTIWFQYEDQTDFTSAPQATDFDCEAFVVTRDSIYLFTKQWASEQTTCYAVAKVPGSHVAHKRGTYNVGGLITGATYVVDKQLVVMCGYDYGGGDLLHALHPFIVLLYDFAGDDFFSGNRRRLNFGTLVKEQIEAIATSDGLDYYVTNERFTTVQLGVEITKPAKLRRLELAPFLAEYLYRLENPEAEDTASAVCDRAVAGGFRVYPNPAAAELNIRSEAGLEGAEYVIFDGRGRRVQSGVLKDSRIRVGRLRAGHYILQIEQGNVKSRIPFIKSLN